MALAQVRFGSVLRGPNPELAQFCVFKFRFVVNSSSRKQLRVQGRCPARLYRPQTWQRARVTILLEVEDLLNPPPPNNQ